MRCTSVKVAAFLTTLVLIGLVAIAGQMNFSPSERPYENTNPIPPVADESAVTADRGGFDARVIVYVVEPSSRWINNANSSYPNYRYHNAVLDFALDTMISLGYTEEFLTNIRWSASENGYSGVTDDNIMVVAAVFDYTDSVWADNGDGGYQWRHLSCAGSYADPSHSFPDSEDGGYTHTVIIEEPTATWCQYCAQMAATLHYIDENDGKNMFYMALVDDVGVANASIRNDEFGICGFPSCFYDGGFRSTCGGYTDYAHYRTRIDACGARAVPDIDCSVVLNWDGGGDMNIDLSVVCNEIVNANPYTPATPAGPSDGTIGLPCEFSTSTTDFEGDSIYVQFSWGNGDTSAWVGPLADDEIGSASYSWSNAGTYQVKARAKDQYPNNESPWSSTTNVLLHTYLAGDANNDLSMNILDIVYLIDYLYNGGPGPVVYYAADADASGVANIIDISYMIAYLYGGGPAPLYPQ